MQEVSDLRAAAALLHWDQSTYMPPGGAAARGRQIGTLNRLAHEKFTDIAIGHLLDDLSALERDYAYESDEASFLRVTRREYEKALKVPGEFEARLADHTADCYQAWTVARPANNFNLVQPLLEKTLELSREQANYFPGYQHIADPLIDDSDEGMTVVTIRQLFTELRTKLLPLAEAITAQSPPDDSFLHRHFPESQQLAFGDEVIQNFGYDFKRGRQDKTHHPFMTKFSLGDVRITTRATENDLSEALFSSMHEAGHALYEQGIDRNYEGTPLAAGASSGVHESQSRLWENLVGRSRVFWDYYFPQLQAAFPRQLVEVSVDSFYAAINKVERSLIRTDADEVTYNLHVMLRFDLELDLLEGKLAVRDLPEAWRDRYSSDLGVTPPDDRSGVLQDVHWFSGVIGGAFQGYTLGNILAAQFFRTAVERHPEIPQHIAQGQFDTLRRWLTENIYCHGKKFTAPELVQRVAGGPLRIEPYMDYLHNKFGALYGL
jgi:carboxypeptidase Taq